MVFQDNDWGSTISFDPGTSISITGSHLELGLATGVDPAELWGRVYHLFDWPVGGPTEGFSIVNDITGGRYYWDTSALYASGNVQLVPEPSTLVFLAIGTVSLLGYVWRRRK